MKKMLLILLCIMCVFTVGCQKKEVINSGNISGESNEKVSGESGLKDDSGIFSGDEINIDNNEKDVLKDDSYIFPNSATKKIEKNELMNLSLDELEKAKNEIFARYGHDFSSKSLKEYFEGKSWYKAVPDKKVSVSELNKIEQANVDIIDKEIERKKERKIVFEKLKLNRKDDGFFKPLIYEGEISIGNEKHILKITTESTECSVGFYYPLCKLYIDDKCVEVSGLMQVYILDVGNKDKLDFAILGGGGILYPKYYFYEYSNNKIELKTELYSFCYDDVYDDVIEKTVMDEENRFLKMYCDIFEEDFLISYLKKNENGFEHKQLGFNLDIDSEKIFTIKKNIQVYNDDSTVTEILSGEKVRVLAVRIGEVAHIFIKISRENGEVIEIEYDPSDAYCV